MDLATLTAELSCALESRVGVTRTLDAGVYLCQVANGDVVVCKTGTNVEVEGKMLRHLAGYLPCARVIYSDASHLVMEYIPSSGRLDEAETARLLAHMHARPFERFGFEYDTTIGPHRQINSWNRSWQDFFADSRIRPMARACYEADRFDKRLLRRIESSLQHRGAMVTEPRHASLLHGDIWSGNVLVRGGQPVFIDPAIYYGHHEMELAFIRLFHTFSSRFFDAYREIMPIEPGFEERVPLLNLYPLLVHVLSFGGGYVEDVERTLTYYGC